MCDVRVARIQKFCTKDGPGVRTTVFLQGCPLRCSWCHNPETQSFQPELMFSESLCIGCGACLAACNSEAHVTVGGIHGIERRRCIGCGACVEVCPTGACEMSCRVMSIEAIMAEIEKDRAFYGNEGGVTLSGGEPMAQPEACISILKQAHMAGINTAVETCGFFGHEWVAALAEYADLILWDMKDSDPERHRKYTGQSNRQIAENLALADRLGARIRLRCIIVEGVNADDGHMAAIANVYSGMEHCEGVELLPYHAYGGSKAVQLGRDDNSNRAWIPSPERMDYLRRKLVNMGVNVI